MKNVITALSNPILNEKLKVEKDINVLINDIQYQEGIFEILQKNNKIDFLILSELLNGNFEIKELVNKIKEKNNYLKIILILENKNDELENYLYAKGIYKIFYNNKVQIKEIIDIINEEYSENEKIMQELEELKKILIKNNILLNSEENNTKNNKDNFLKYIINKIKIIKNINNKEKININKKIISILGTGGVGKSITTINIANLLKENNNKVLIIDFDILNNNLHTLLNVDKYPEKIKEKMKNLSLINNKLNIKELIIKINNNINLISGINLIFDEKYKISSKKIKFILNELIEYYDFIIIDNSSECFFEYTKNIIENSDLNIFLIESNYIEIKKAKRLLDIYNKEWKIEKNKIKILINKYNKYSIKNKNIENIFDEYKILGKINFNKKYNKLINKNNKNNNLIKKRINNEYKKIIKKNNKKIKIKNKKILKKINIKNKYKKII